MGDPIRLAGAGFAANDMVIVTAEWFRPRDFFLSLLFLTFKRRGGGGGIFSPTVKANDMVIVANR